MLPFLARQGDELVARIESRREEPVHAGIIEARDSGTETGRKDHHGQRGFVSRHRDRGQGVGNRALEKS